MDGLLALLNTSSVLDGAAHDELAEPARGRRWMTEHGGTGTPAELERVRRARDLLQAVVRREQPRSALGPLLEGVHRKPEITEDGLNWVLVGDRDSRLAVEMVLAFAEAEERLPGRLRPCENDECRLFLLDRSRANRARWCSMAACGNREKARRHYERHRPPS
ncbi:CGNR zinc finger domain-containing protein [Amycolatopsis sp. H20-H5]|uniref:CGNR zinc finger domain-containing protein n=1 Tax=Amycolatopsis sp. H20-H5 TaxID=3046309 RepID=UPI002DB66590|nr:CGNR zinc finger domain-containing protein [Amycolatopsis sp. H20-H5]MEC3980892.1 CGNR zinc finger domain-containing protein [Amycolatopsis sp. H20-H5]